MRPVCSNGPKCTLHNGDDGHARARTAGDRPEKQKVHSENQKHVLQAYPIDKPLPLNDPCVFSISWPPVLD
jgi:hypothetical protein